MTSSRPKPNSTSGRYPPAVRYAASMDLPWRLQLSTGMPLEICSQVGETGMTGVSVPGLAEALRYVNAGVGSILVHLPPAARELRLVSDLLNSSDLIVALDHYVQAEKLANLAQRCGRSIQVALLLQSAVCSPGIRPGDDALQLLRGIQQLPAVQVVGMVVNLDEVRDSGSIVKAAEHTLSLCKRCGVGGLSLVVMLGDNVKLPESGAMTEVCIRPDLPPSDCGGESTLLQVDVVSRPSLEIAVLNVGRAELGQRPKVRFPDYSGTRVLRWMNDCCVIEATGRARQLTIGDVVRLSIGSAPG